MICVHICSCVTDNVSLALQPCYPGFLPVLPWSYLTMLIWLSDWFCTWLFLPLCVRLGLPVYA